MKIGGILFAVVFCCITSLACAQKITYENLAGDWEYKNAKKKTKLIFNLMPDKTFKSTMEHGDTETINKGHFLLEKKGELDRLRASIDVEGLKVRSQTIYYFLKYVSTDTIKVQMVNDKETSWKEETDKNTKTLVRKKEKEKKKDE